MKLPLILINYIFNCSYLILFFLTVSSHFYCGSFATINNFQIKDINRIIIDK